MRNLSTGWKFPRFVRVGNVAPIVGRVEREGRERSHDLTPWHHSMTVGHSKAQNFRLNKQHARYDTLPRDLNIIIIYKAWSVRIYRPLRSRGRTAYAACRALQNKLAKFDRDRSRVAKTTALRISNDGSASCHRLFSGRFHGKNLNGGSYRAIIARREAREIVEINKVLTPITVLLYLHLSFRYTIYRASCNKRELA